MSLRERLGQQRWKLIVAAVAFALVAALPLAIGASFALFTTSSANGNNSFATLTVQPPTATAATSKIAGGIQVDWNASPTAGIRAVKYLVFRRPSGVGGYSQVTGSPIAGLSHTDTPPADGLYDYVVQTYVGGFTSPDSNSVTGRSDRTPPSVSITCNGGSCAGLMASPVSVRITASDAGVGVASITHSVDGGANTTTAGASVTFSVSGGGAHTISYFATDNVGNAGAAQTANFTIEAVTNWAVCDINGWAPTQSPNWLRQSGRYIVYANVSGAATVTADVGKTGSAPFASGIALTSGSYSCAGTAYNYASPQQTAPDTLVAGSNTVFADIIATNGAAVAHTDASDGGNVSVDAVVPTDPIPGGGSPAPKTITFTWTPSVDANSGVAGYWILIVDASNGFAPPPNYPTAIIVPPGTTSYTFTNLVSGHTYDIGIVTSDNAGNNTLNIAWNTVAS